MNGFFQNAFQVFFIIGYLFLYVISFIILKPFRIHRKRPISTILLKLSYLIFLVVFLVFTYLLLFGAKEHSNDNLPYDTLFNIHFLLFLSSSIIPNVGIMLRRKINKKRIEYNLICACINLIYFGYLIFAISSGKWALL